MTQTLNPSNSIHFPSAWDDTWPPLMPSYLSSFVIVQFRSFIRWNKESSSNIVFNPPSSLTHTFNVSFVNGLETLEINAIKLFEDHHYIVYCCGMEEDALSFDVTSIQPNQSAIIWNYPSQGQSQGHVRSAKDLFKPAFYQVMRLLNKGIPDKNITLHGYSLGGGVATAVARQLHEQGHFVHLKVERSFARFSSVVPALVNKIDVEKAPLVTSILALAVTGFALGIAFAGFVNALGHLATEAMMTDSMPASIVAETVNVLASFIGGIIALSSLILGCVLGTILGILLTVQLLWTNNPFILSVTPAFENILLSFCFEMDSVAELQQLLATHDKPEHETKEKPTITVINTVDDEVITIAAAFNTKLELEPEDNFQRPSIKDKVTSFWYLKGGHRGTLDGPIRSDSFYQF